MGSVYLNAREEPLPSSQMLFTAGKQTAVLWIQYMESSSVDWSEVKEAFESMDTG